MPWQSLRYIPGTVALPTVRKSATPPSDHKNMVRTCAMHDAAHRHCVEMKILRCKVRRPASLYESWFFPAFFFFGCVVFFLFFVLVFCVVFFRFVLLVVLCLLVL